MKTLHLLVQTCHLLISSRFFFCSSFFQNVFLLVLRLLGFAVNVLPSSDILKVIDSPVVRAFPTNPICTYLRPPCTRVMEPAGVSVLNCAVSVGPISSPVLSLQTHHFKLDLVLLTCRASLLHCDKLVKHSGVSQVIANGSYLNVVVCVVRPSERDPDAFQARHASDNMRVPEPGSASLHCVLHKARMARWEICVLSNEDMVILANLNRLDVFDHNRAEAQRLAQWGERFEKKHLLPCRRSAHKVAYLHFQ